MDNLPGVNGSSLRKYQNITSHIEAFLSDGRAVVSGIQIVFCDALVAPGVSRKGNASQLFQLIIIGNFRNIARLQLNHGHCAPIPVVNHRSPVIAENPVLITVRQIHGHCLAFLAYSFYHHRRRGCVNIYRLLLLHIFISALKGGFLCQTGGAASCQYQTKA